MDKENILRMGGGYEDVKEKDEALLHLQKLWEYLQKRLQLRRAALNNLADDRDTDFTTEFEMDRDSIRQLGSSVSFM